MLDREQIGVEFHLLLCRQLFGDLMDQAVYVGLPRPGSEYGRVFLL